MPASGNEDGDARVVQDTQSLYIWTEGSGWVEVSGGGGGGGNAFTIFQGTSGTSPTATTPTSTLTFESHNNSVNFAGDSSTDTFDVTVNFIQGTGTDNAIVRIDGTNGIQGSSLLVDDLASDSVCMQAVGASLVLSTNGSKTSPGGSNAWLDIYNPSGARMRYINDGYSSTVGAVEWSSVRVLHRIPVTFVDDTVPLGRRLDGTYERPTAIYSAEYIGIANTGNPTASTVLEIAGSAGGGSVGAFLNARMTTTEKLLLTPVAGMQVYDVTLSKLQVYSGGVWVDLH